MSDSRKLYYFLAVKDIVETFAETEIGSGCEIDVDAVDAYCSSLRFVNDMWGIYNKEEIYQAVTDDILAGYPIWQLLKIPEWTKNMLEREFAREQQRKREELEREYKCYTCKYFVEKETGLGTWMECTWKPLETKRNFDWRPRRGSNFEVKKRCKNYERKEDEADVHILQKL